MKSFFLTLMLVLCASLAMAIETTPAGEAVVSFLHAVVFPVVSAFLLGMVGIIINKIRVKYNLDISAEQQANLEAYARQGIALAEEKAADFAKRKVATLTGSDKLDVAVAHILTALPKVTPDQADRMVHSVLGKISGIGASGDVAVKG
jgi:hypothetical protein